MSDRMLFFLFFSILLFAGFGIVNALITNNPVWLVGLLIAAAITWFVNRSLK